MNITKSGSLAGDKALRKSQKKQVKSKNENKQEKRGTRNRENSKINIFEIIKTDFFHVFLGIRMKSLVSLSVK